MTMIQVRSVRARLLTPESRRWAGHVARYTLFTAIGVTFMLPFVLAFLGGFKTDREIFAFPPRVLPDGWTGQGRFEGEDALPHYPLTDLFSDDLATIPEERIQMRRRSEVPFTVTGEARVGWTVRDQYGISNWINVFRAGQCKDGWLGPYCFPYWLWNSVFLASVNVLTRVFLAAIAGYTFARMRFPGKNVIFTFMLATMMLPGAVTLIPGYVLIADLGWVGTFWSLIIPGAVEVFGIFLMTQFLKAVPIDLEEAARVDGASQWQIISKVVLPLARPALVTLAILSFQASWNSFQTPLLYLRGDPSVFTLPVGLQFFQQQFRQQWNLTLIGSMFNAIPVLVIFLAFNRYFIEGVSYSGIKG